jgi:hypothetical protein
VQARHYERYDFLPEKRSALQLWEEHLASVVAGKVKTSARRKPPTATVGVALERASALA